MLHGDISNKSAPYIGFDLDSLLFMEKKRTIWGQVRDMFRDSAKLYMERDYNQVFVHTIRKLWNNHNVSIVFLTCELFGDDLQELGRKLDNDLVPYTHLYAYYEWEDLRHLCRDVLMYFFSGNAELVSYCSAKNALHFDQVRSVFGKYE